MRMLLTNDDGYDAPGLLALYRAAAALSGARLRVISTSAPYSGKGHVVSPQFCCRDMQIPEMGVVTVVDGTPADCVRAAMALPDEPRPEVVLSGINYGSNLGIDVYYSGTVAAAREAAILGFPAIAISQLVKESSSADWEAIARIAACIIAALVQPDAPPPPGLDVDLHAEVARLAASPAAGEAGFWNVNLPCTAAGQPPQGLRLTALSTDGYHLDYSASRDEHGRLCLANHGNYHARPVAPGTDVAATFEGFISLTRVRI